MWVRYKSEIYILNFIFVSDPKKIMYSVLYTLRLQHNVYCLDIQVSKSLSPVMSIALSASVPFLSGF